MRGYSGELVTLHINIIIYFGLVVSLDQELLNLLDTLGKSSATDNCCFLKLYRGESP